MVHAHIRDHTKLTFYSSLASSLIAHRYITPLQGDIIRQGLVESDKKGNDFFKEIYRDCEALFTATFTLIPQESLFSIYYRFLLQSPLGQLEDILSNLCSSLVDKTKLFFNRPHFLTHPDQPSTQTLKSVVILQVAEEVELILQRLQKTSHLIRQYPIGNSDEFSKTLATHLGMDDGRHSCLPLFQENEINQELSALLEKLCRLLSSSEKALIPSFSSSKAVSSSLTISEINSLCFSIKSTKFDPAARFENWEQQSGSSLNKLQETVDLLKNWVKDYLACLQAESPGRVNQGKALLSFKMIEKVQSSGIDPATTLSIVSSLQKYCLSRKINLSEVTAIELPKISPSLSPRLLQEMQEIAKDSSMNQTMSQQKDHVWRSGKRIQRRLGLEP